MKDFRPTRRGIVALVLGLAGFVIYMGESSKTTVNGRVTSSHDYNYAAFVLGVAAIAVAGYAAMAIVRGARRDLAGAPAMHYGFLGVVALLGIYQALHGLDLV